MKAAPRAQLIVDYKSWFGIEPPINKISLINFISREHLLYELTALNYRLKPKDKIVIDSSLETQLKELKYFTMTKELHSQYLFNFRKHTRSSKDYPIIFHRQGCLYGIEEIINSLEMQNTENFNMARIEVWDAILKYLLAVNYEITYLKEEKDDNNVDFESLNPKMIPLNELTVETDQIFTPFRGYNLIKYYYDHPDFHEEVVKYFQEKYGMEYDYFILEILKMYVTPRNDIPEHEFCYTLEGNDDGLFEPLSRMHLNNETYKLLSIRKSPFIKAANRKYLVTDITFLIEKTYSQFLNDFWFDWLKEITNDDGTSKFTFKLYRGVFGYFFESYLAQILKNSFENYKYSKLLLFDNLKIKRTIGEIEIADIYFRYGNKIILGQVKAGSIYDEEKYGGNVKLLYKNDRNKFFEKFGINQLIASLTRMDNYIQEIDPNFPKGHSYNVFPCIIVNDKAFQTPLMPDTFNTRFQELLKDFNIKKVKVFPLTLIHISDLERIEDFLNKNPSKIWDFLKYNYRDRLFIPPFYSSIKYDWQSGQYPERVLHLYRSILEKYFPKSTLVK